MENTPTTRNVILGIIKAHYNIVKTRPSNVNCENINAIAMEPTHDQCKGEFMILFISPSDTIYCYEHYPHHNKTVLFKSGTSVYFLFQRGLVSQ